jgi:hypothetical protein
LTKFASIGFASSLASSLAATDVRFFLGGVDGTQYQFSPNESAPCRRREKMTQCAEDGGAPQLFHYWGSSYQRQDG